MGTNAGLKPKSQRHLGRYVGDERGHHLRVLAPSTGKASGTRYLPIVAGLGIAADILGKPDLLLIQGAEWIFKDAFRGARFVCDGQYLRPLGGAAICAMRAASLATPVYRLTLTSAIGSFIPPERPVIPANLLIPGQSQVRVEIWVRHSTATIASQINVRFGTAGGLSDSRVISVPTNTTANQDTRIDLLVDIGTATTATSTETLAPGSQGVAIGQDITTGIDVTQPMTVTADISGSAAGDVFDLIFYRVTLIQ